METLFHVDRTGALSAGQTLGLTPWQTMPPDQKIPDVALQAHVEAMFPDGLSRHGLGFFFWQNKPVVPPTAGFYDQKQSSEIRSYGIELIWEYVRRAAFPERPSRYQSNFCWATMPDVDRFLANMNAPGAAVWQVKGEVTFKADMNRLTALMAAGTSHQAHRYWSGEPEQRQPPHWEHFVAPGATVQARVR